MFVIDLGSANIETRQRNVPEEVMENLFELEPWS